MPDVPSQLDAYFFRAAPMMADVLGSETIELRRPLTLRDPGLETLSSVVAHADAATGATLLVVASADGRPLRGLIPANLTLGLPASLVAATTTDADTGGGQAATLALAVTALPAAVVAGAVVGLADYARYLITNCTVHNVLESLVDQTELAGEVSFAASLPFATSPVQPRTGDLLFTSRGQGVVLEEPGDGGGSWEVLAGKVAGGPRSKGFG